MTISTAGNYHGRTDGVKAAICSALPFADAIDPNDVTAREAH
jgi:hypothetical protein